MDEIQHLKRLYQRLNSRKHRLNKKGDHFREHDLDASIVWGPEWCTYEQWDKNAHQERKNN